MCLHGLGSSLRPKDEQSSGGVRSGLSQGVGEPVGPSTDAESEPALPQRFQYSSKT